MNIKQLYRQYQINIDQILNPISDNSPSGEYYRYTEVYDDISYAFREDNPRLAQGIWEKPLKKADWEGGKNIATIALEHKTKDLQLTGWLTLSLLKLHGFSGFVTGLGIMNELLENFWETIHPLPLDNDYEIRLAPLYWISEKFPSYVTQIPITRNPLKNHYYTYETWEKDNILLKQNKSESQIDPTDQLFNFLKLSSLDFQKELNDSLLECINSINNLKKFLKSKTEQYPHFVQLEETLQGIIALNEYSISELEKQVKDTTDIDNTKHEVNAESMNDAMLSGSEEKLLRNDPYLILRQSAISIMKNNPEDRTGQLIIDILEQRDASFEELLLTYTNDQNKINTIFKLLNIQ